MLSLLKTLGTFIAGSTRAARDTPRLDSLLLQRNTTLVLLLALAAAAWAVLVWHHRDVNMDMASPAMVLHAPLFLAMWAVMMVAMMFPTAAPMILAFQKVQAAKRQPDDAFVSTWVFVTAYLLVWALAGIAAYAGVLVAEMASVRSALGPTSAAQFGGAFLMIAGIYQLTPLKEICLSECRTPIVMTSWHDDAAGAFRMGLLHGLYCLGCCWLFFVVLFPLGMNVGTMAVVTLIIFAEKTLPWPTVVRYTGAVVLVLYGALVIASPLLTFPKDGSAARPAEMQMKMPGSGSTPAIR